MILRLIAVVIFSRYELKLFLFCRPELQSLLHRAFLYALCEQKPPPVSRSDPERTGQEEPDLPAGGPLMTLEAAVP